MAINLKQGILRKVTFAQRKLAIYNRAPDEMRKIRIQERKERHVKFKEAYIAAKRALQPHEEYLDDTYDRET